MNVVSLANEKSFPFRCYAVCALGWVERFVTRNSQNWLDWLILRVRYAGVGTASSRPSIVEAACYLCWGDGGRESTWVGDISTNLERGGEKWRKANPPVDCNDVATDM